MSDRAERLREAVFRTAGKKGVTRKILRAVVDTLGLNADHVAILSEWIKREMDDCVFTDREASLESVTRTKGLLQMENLHSALSDLLTAAGVER